MKNYLPVALLLGCSFLLSCDNDEERLSFDEAKLIVPSLDSLEGHTYLSTDPFTLVDDEIRLIDTTFNGAAGGSAQVSGEVKSRRAGGHCGGPVYRSGSLPVNLIDYSEGAQLTNAGAFDYGGTGFWWSGICDEPRSYSRQDTITFFSPKLNVVYVDNSRGINIHDDVEIKVIYVHHYYQLRPFGEPSVTVDSTVTRKYHIKSSTGRTFDWQQPE